MFLSPLLANQSVERILLYLLMNGKCYAAQLSRSFTAPQTPLQQALQKLESKGVLKSYLEGKTRFYEFNTAYPLLGELEELLKKGYNYLSYEEKKLYYCPEPPVMKTKARRKSHSSQDTLQLLWRKLPEIQNLSLSAKSKAITFTGWNGLGKGTVQVKQVDEGTIHFHEQGQWITQQEKEMSFSNIFCWRLLKNPGVITLEHLRFGPNHPVFLFTLIPQEENTLESQQPHICKEDSYFGKVRCDDHFIQLNWRVIGPKKNEEIDYLYT